MKPIRGLTLEDLSAVTIFGDPKAGWQNNNELEVAVAKGRRFADSVLGRELFHRLPSISAVETAMSSHSSVLKASPSTEHTIREPSVSSSSGLSSARIV